MSIQITFPRQQTRAQEKFVGDDFIEDFNSEPTEDYDALEDATASEEIFSLQNQLNKLDLKNKKILKPIQPIVIALEKNTCNSQPRLLLYDH